MPDSSSVFIPPYPTCPANWRKGSYDLTKISFFFHVRTITTLGRPLVNVSAFFGFHYPAEGHEMYKIGVKCTLQVPKEDPSAQKAYQIVSGHSMYFEDEFNYFIEASQNPLVQEMRRIFLQRRLDCHGIVMQGGLRTCWAFDNAVLSEVLAMM